MLETLNILYIKIITNCKQTASVTK